MHLQNSSDEMSKALECRAGRADDYPAAAQLRQEMAVEMGGDFDAMASDWRTKFCAYFGGKQAAREGQLFLAFDDGQPVGCATITIADDYRRYCFGILSAHVNAVYVKPVYRRRGLAARLMKLALEWARERGCKRVRLRASEQGRFLYDSLGFHAGREMEIDL